jgi:hypothetical protein
MVFVRVCLLCVLGILTGCTSTQELKVKCEQPGDYSVQYNPKTESLTPIHLPVGITLSTSSKTDVIMELSRQGCTLLPK